MWLKTLLPLLSLALTAHATLPSSGGPYLISNEVAGNSVSQFLTVAGFQTGVSGIQAGLVPQQPFPPPPSQQWNLQQLGEDGFFGLYYISSALGPTALFGMGTSNGSPAVVSPVGTVFNISVDAGSGLFLIGVVNAVFNFQQAGFVLTDNSRDSNFAQQPTSTPHEAGNSAQLWNIVRSP